MTFPAWCESEDSLERAQLRLRYIVNTLASKATPAGTIQALADLCDVDNSTMHNSLRAGRFSLFSAMKIERACPGLVTVDALTSPLEME